MEDGSEHGHFWNKLHKLFGYRQDTPIEEVIMEASEDGEIENDEVSMLLNVLRLDTKQVKEIMVPRTEMICAEENESLKEIAGLIIDSGHSRIPVYRQSKDNIIGLIHAKDLLPFFVNPDNHKVDPASIIRPPLFIPDTKNVRDILLEFQAKKIHLAIALDEYGGTSGLVTLEDVLEEIVGEIEDEYDTPKPEEIQFIDDRRTLISGRTSLDTVREACSIDLQSDQVETIGGLLCEHAGKVPQKGDHLTIAGHDFEIKEADNKHILWVVVTPSAQTISRTP
ncbi:magnesium transporter [Desulfoplanes formicivorans]|uniref:Magnesium transporter n=2 Tax=Desulfoplanes formicivorans TaxID=1592317 RepID=A0A194AJT8_9BACT|nr:magnesium transporter [Desulfoplanes formicivorans]